MTAEFDQYAKNYQEVLNESVGITGFDGDHFVKAKLEKLASLYPELCTKYFQFLDFGCGSGKSGHHIFKYFPNVHYTGTDPSPEMIKQARESKILQAEFFEIDSTDWKKKSYDLIFAACVFHHIDPQQHHANIDTLTNLLTSDGHLVIYEHNPLNPFTRRIFNQCEFDQDATLISPNRLLTLMRRTGLENRQRIYTTFFPKFLNKLRPMEDHLGWLPLGGQYLVTGTKLKP